MDATVSQTPNRTDYAIVEYGNIDTRKQVGCDAVEQRKIGRCQLRYVHILHGQQKNLEIDRMREKMKPKEKEQRELEKDE